MEYRTVGKEDGLIRWVAAKGRAMFDSSGKCVRVIGTAIDITANKAIEQTLAQRAHLLDLTHDVIIVGDEDSRIVFWNSGAEELYGWKADEVVGQSGFWVRHSGAGFRATTCFWVREDTLY